MRTSHLFLALLVVGGLVLAGAAFGLPTVPLSLSPAPAEPAFPPQPALPPAPAPAADAEAAATLDRALAALDDARVGWLEAEVWQRVRVPGYAYEADGYYLKAPGGRFRLQVRTHVGDKAGGLLMVCDGEELWQATRAGDGPWKGPARPERSETAALLEGLGARVGKKAERVPTPVAAPGGVAPLLRRLRERLLWAREEVTHHGGEEAVRLTGVWPAEEAESLAPAGSAWPACTPRQCRLTLDARSLWPRRIEWGGPVAPEGGDLLLAEIEFRNPVFNRPLPDDRCAREFTIPAEAATP
jgi:hypothetical protein